jgi:hypothetical protein
MEFLTAVKIIIRAYFYGTQKLRVNVDYTVKGLVTGER